MGLLEMIASAKVTDEQLGRAVETVERERRDGDSSPVEFVLLREFGPDGIAPEVFAAIMFRMEALALAIKDKTASHWIIEIAGEEHFLVPENLFAAAAAAPLVVSKNSHGATFEPGEFLRLALEHAEPEGNG